MTRGKFLLKFLFILIIIGLWLSLVAPIFIPKWYPSSDAIKGFFAEEPNTIDVLALGTSRTVFSSVPWIFWEKFGIPVYSLAVEQQPTIASYYLLKEALKTQDLKAVLIEVQALNRDRSYQDGEAYFRQNFDNMPFSLNKMEIAYQLVSGSNNQSLISYIFPFLRYHDRWNQLTKEDYTDINTRRSPVKGGLLALNQVGISLFAKDYPVSTGKPYNLPYDNEKYLFEIIKLCQKDNIDLVLYATPTYVWTKEQSAYYDSLAEQESHVHFIEFNTYESQEEIGFDISTDFFDKGGHVNSFGAEKLMTKIAEFMRRELGFPDHRGDSRYASWDQSVVYVNLAKNDNYLNQSSDFLKYLSYLKDPNYVVAISAADDAASGLSQEAYGLLRDVGLTGPTAFRNSYVALIDGDKVIYEKMDATRIEFTTTINGNIWTITSVGGTQGALSTIMLNGINYTPTLRGLNIVVFNKVKDEVVNISNFDTYKTSMVRMYLSSKPLK
jgi:hypothetical protein